MNLKKPKYAANKIHNKVLHGVFISDHNRDDDPKRKQRKKGIMPTYSQLYRLAVLKVGKGNLQSVNKEFPDLAKVFQFKEITKTYHHGSSFFYSFCTSRSECTSCSCWCYSLECTGRARTQWICQVHEGRSILENCSTTKCSKF